MMQSMKQRWNFCVFVCGAESRDGGARAPAAAQHWVVGGFTSGVSKEASPKES